MSNPTSLSITPGEAGEITIEIGPDAVSIGIKRAHSTGGQPISEKKDVTTPPVHTEEPMAKIPKIADEAIHPPVADKPVVDDCLRVFDATKLFNKRVPMNIRTESRQLLASQATLLCNQNRLVHGNSETVSINDQGALILSEKLAVFPRVVILGIANSDRAFGHLAETTAVISDIMNALPESDALCIVDRTTLANSDKLGINKTDLLLELFEHGTNVTNQYVQTIRERVQQYTVDLGWYNAGAYGQPIRWKAVDSITTGNNNNNGASETDRLAVDAYCSDNPTIIRGRREMFDIEHGKLVSTMATDNSLYVVFFHSQTTPNLVVSQAIMQVPPTQLCIVDSSDVGLVPVITEKIGQFDAIPVVHKPHHRVINIDSGRPVDRACAKTNSNHDFVYVLFKHGQLVDWPALKSEIEEEERVLAPLSVYAHYLQRFGRSRAISQDVLPAAGPPMNPCLSLHGGAPYNTLLDMSCWNNNDQRWENQKVQRAPLTPKYGIFQKNM